MNKDQQAVAAIAKSIHARLANTKNLQVAVQTHKLRNARLVKKFLQIKRICEIAIEEDFVRCKKCGVELTGERGLAIHTARVHK